MSLSIDNIKLNSGRTEILGDLNKQIKNIHFENYDEESIELTEHELKSLVENKMNYIIEGLKTIPFKLEFNGEVKSINRELDSIKKIHKFSRKDTLETQNRNLDTLTNRYERLKEKKDNLVDKGKDPIIKKPIDEMFSFRNSMEQKYGKFFFVHMSKEERESLLQLYMKSYNVSREYAEVTLENSYIFALNEYNKMRNR